jgi:antitoxin (DNA-binding transcriptional repressor) of toxin-antitoxin stability system
VIAKGGELVPKLVPLDVRDTPSVPGAAAATIDIADDFNAPLPEDLLWEFEA